MAKKAKAEAVEVATQEVAVKTAPKKEVKPAKPSWEIKDRIYFLKGNKTPLTYTIPSKHTKKHSLLYFDEKSGKQREIRLDMLQIKIHHLLMNKKVKLLLVTLCLWMEI